MSFLLLQVSQFGGNQRAGLQGEGRLVSSDFGSSLTQKPVCAITKHAGKHSAFIPGRWAVCEKKIKFPSGLIQAASMVLHESCDECAERLWAVKSKTRTKGIGQSSCLLGCDLCYVYIWDEAVRWAFTSLLRMIDTCALPRTQKCQKHTLSKRTFSDFSITDQRPILHLSHVNTAGVCVCARVHVCASTWSDITCFFSIQFVSCCMFGDEDNQQTHTFYYIFRYVMIVSGRL